MGTKHDNMVDEEVAADEQIDSEADEILNALAQSLVNLETARGAFIGTPSQENLSEYMACVRTVQENHQMVEAVLTAARISNTLDDMGSDLIDAAHAAAYKRMVSSKVEPAHD